VTFDIVIGDEAYWDNQRDSFGEMFVGYLAEARS
jgi:hypothetical protein